MSTIVQNKLFEDIKGNALALASIADCMTTLQNIGFLKYARMYFKPALAVSTSETIEKAALDGAYTAGANDALDLLENFVAICRTVEQTPLAPRADFGSIDTLLKTGQITKDEYDAIKRGERPNYAAYINTKAVTSSPAEK